MPNLWITLLTASSTCPAYTVCLIVTGKNFYVDVKSVLDMALMMRLEKIQEDVKAKAEKEKEAQKDEEEKES